LRLSAKACSIFRRELFTQLMFTIEPN
jgi:hypothetical protein